MPDILYNGWASMILVMFLGSAKALHCWGDALHDACHGDTLLGGLRCHTVRPHSTASWGYCTLWVLGLPLAATVVGCYRSTTRCSTSIVVCSGVIRYAADDCADLCVLQACKYPGASTLAQCCNTVFEVTVRSPWSDH
jgi:hypothetical protein